MSLFFDCCLTVIVSFYFFFFSSRRRHTRSDRDWSSDVCSSDLDMNMRDLMNTLLESEGYEVIQAENAAAVQAAFEGPQPDAVLLDLQLPDGRSEERRVGKECRSRWSPYH